MSYRRPRNSGAAIDINAAAAVRSNAHYYGDSVVVRSGGANFTYTQLDDLAARLATALTERLSLLPRLD